MTNNERKLCRWNGIIGFALCVGAAVTIDIFIIVSWYIGLMPINIGGIMGTVLLFILGRMPMLFWYTFYFGMIEDECGIIFPELNGISRN